MHPLVPFLCASSVTAHLETEEMTRQSCIRGDDVTSREVSSGSVSVLVPTVSRLTS